MNLPEVMEELMLDHPTVWLAASVVVFLGILVAPPLLAVRKGYKWYLWTFLACGVIGLVVLAFQPFANESGLSECKRRRRANAGNRVGRILTWLTLGLASLQFIFAKR